jgi:hypothetical protein
VADRKDTTDQTISETTTVVERPILFSGPMVRAILDGQKTQTRRIIKTLPGEEFCALNARSSAVFTVDQRTYREVRNPYGDEGDLLWVRETFLVVDPMTRYFQDAPKIVYRADDWDIKPDKWTPSIFMPRKLSRITLRITGLRVERLQCITEAGAKAEGVKPLECFTTNPLGGYYGFSYLWDKINGKVAPWNSNPWVWVVSFKREGR